MQISSLSKERGFFEYLLELTKLTGKVVRDYTNYERHWVPKALKEIEGCLVEDECDSDDIYLEIHRPQITKAEEISPTPDLYQFLAQNLKKGIQYIYKIWKLMNEWKKE